MSRILALFVIAAEKIEAFFLCWITADMIVAVALEADDQFYP